VRSTLPKQGIAAKFEAEPTSPNPRPTVLIVAADAENAVLISTLIAVSPTPVTNSMRIYSTIKRRTA
jgi:hypothetical protein